MAAEPDFSGTFRHEGGISAASRSCFGAFVAEKYAWISAAFPRIAALRIAAVRLFPDGNSRARRKASIALEFSSQANDG
ncbi:MULTISPECIES: hypothetical protein [unclassified Bradyrhizobium]|uniref:hypothetical protein n=1 Tax=unclassified Bradyrhizobium TaxID=2631580 RepID=UPI0004888BBB|nr:MULTISPECIES: hypothetical protein [unclassified Bradyrhizobium]